MKLTQENFLNTQFRASGPKYSSTLLQDSKSSRDRLTHIVILTNWGSISRNLGIFYSPEDSKVTPDGLALEWNGHSKTFWTLTFKLLDGNIALVHLKNERAAETALRASWFWSHSARFPGTWGIFSSPGDSKLTPDGHGLQWNLHSTSFWTPTFEVLDRNRAPLHLKTERVAETDWRASWFWATSPRFAGT